MNLFWLEVIQEIESVKPEKLFSVIKEANELCCILASARKTYQKSLAAKNIKY